MKQWWKWTRWNDGNEPALLSTSVSEHLLDVLQAGNVPEAKNSHSIVMSGCSRGIFHICLHWLHLIRSHKRTKDWEETDSSWAWNVQAATKPAKRLSFCRDTTLARNLSFSWIPSILLGLEPKQNPGLSVQNICRNPPSHARPELLIWPGNRPRGAGFWTGMPEPLGFSLVCSY